MTSPDPADTPSVSDAQNEALTIVYDGECPVCTAYSCMISLDRPSELVNARVGGELVEHIQQTGLNLDDGMVVLRGGVYYHGADAMHLLALHSTAPGFFNRLNHIVFRSRRRARFFYPALRLGRNMLLRLLGRRKIGQ